MSEICKKCNEGFEVRVEDLEFLSKVSLTFDGKKFEVPMPSLCPDCRQQRRLCWHNERNLYKRNCDATGASLVSNISEDKPYKVYDKTYWFSDKWNTLDYGRDFDFSKSFAENFSDLQKVVPRFAIQQQLPMENSDYCNFASNCKNSYFLFDSDFCEDCLYSNVLKNSEDCCDCSFVSNSQLCYEVINCTDCYALKFSRNCHNCSNSVFLEGCVGCKNCAFSTNLHNKEYYYANKKYSKEEYEKKISELELGKSQNSFKYMKYCNDFLVTQPRRFMQGFQNENVVGDYIYNSKNAYKCYNVSECWDVAYCDLLFRAKNCMDVSSFGENIELIYECTTSGLNTQRSMFCFAPVVGSSDLMYCDTVYSSKNCFGCVSLNRNEYCILNKQYTKEDYEKTVAKIIEHMIKTGEWGEFLHSSLSPVAYNESVASDYFPLAKAEALEQGFSWKDKDNRDYQAATAVIPNNISDVNDEILSEILACVDCSKNYKITQLELDLYRRIDTPVPMKCPDCRHSYRLELSHPRHLWDRECEGCKELVATTFSPDGNEKIYCEECYMGVVD